MKLCECGCGQPAPIAQQTNARLGIKRGVPHRFIAGHNARVQQWKGEKANLSTIHEWLRKHFEKTGSCEVCGKVGKTDWAYLHHPAPYSRERADYREMCRSCHLSFDEPITGRARKMRERSRAA